MSVNESPTKQGEAADETSISWGVLAATAYLLIVAALMDVGLAFWHRHQIVKMWEDLRRKSYPPFEAYETIGIDFHAAFGFWPISCAWVVFQTISAILYLCCCRKAGLIAGSCWLFLWLLSLIGAIGFWHVLQTAGWGQ
jgi:hypothetical protein